MASLSSTTSSTSPPPLGVRVRRGIVTAGLLGLLGTLLYVKGVPCAFAHVFHLPCPGCGSTRSVVALLHGDLEGVLRFNPLGPPLALFAGVFALQALASIVSYGDVRAAGTGRVGAVVKYGIFIVAGFAGALWIARFFGLFGGPVPVG